jgi:hypothetical protein
MPGTRVACHSDPAHPRKRAHEGDRAGGRMRAWRMAAQSSVGNKGIVRIAVRSGIDCGGGNRLPSEMAPAPKPC